MKPTIIQYWHDEAVPADIETLFSLAKKHNPDMRHLAFNRRTAMNLLKTHLTPREVTAFEACAVPAMQADYFRYCAIYALGGVYCDADSSCTGSLMPLLEPDGTLFENIRVPGLITNHLFAFKAPGHPLLRLTIDIATSGVKSRFAESVSAVTGPEIFTLLSKILKRGSVDAHLDHLRGVVGRNADLFAVDVERWNRHLDSIRTVIGSYSRVVDAFDGVRVSPYKDIDEIVSRGSSHLAYKKTTDHLPNWQGSIYR